DIAGGAAVGLLLRAEVERTHGEQPLPRVTEELLGVSVRIDEGALLDVEDHDGIGRVLHERAVTLLALPQGLLRPLELREIDLDADGALRLPRIAQLGHAGREEIDRAAVLAEVAQREVLDDAFASRLFLVDGFPES